MKLVSRFSKSPFLIIIVVMTVYVAFAFYGDIGKLSKAELKINYLALPLIFVSMTAVIALLGLRFHKFLHILDIKLSIKKSIMFYITGLSLAVTPGTSGQIIKSQIMKREFGHAISKTSPIILVEKWNELCAALLILIVLVLIHAILESVLIVMIGITIAIFLFGIMRYRILFNSLKKLILRFPRLRTFEESIENSQDTLRLLTSKRNVLGGLIMTTPAMVVQAIVVYFAFHALGINITFVLSTQIFYVALISGILSFLPGGLGVTEGSMAALLLKYYNHDVPIAGAIIFIRLITLWYPTFLGIILGQFILKYKTVPRQERNE